LQEQWRMAALLLTQEEAGIVGYLADRHRDFMSAGDEAEAARWLDFTLKVETIMDSGAKSAD